MMLKSHILFVFFSLLSLPVFSQFEADISHPSVNADQFGVAVKAETSLSKGQLSLNIPLMTLRGKGYDLPISVVFYGGDVTACTEASPIGLGWALMAGGVIATTIRGADDLVNYATGCNNAHHNDSNCIEQVYNDEIQLLSLVNDIQYDPMPDEQTYSLPGHNGTVEASYEDNTIKRTLFPDESYKIEPITQGYCITDDDGNKFYFEDAEYRSSWDSSNNENMESTSWFLTRIITAKGGEFTFLYADEEYITLSSIRSDSEHTIYRTKRITSIVSDYGSVTFLCDTRPDRGNFGYPSITPGKESKRIKKIELRDENGEFVKGYELDNSGSFKLYEHQYENPDYAWYNYRLKLSSITQYDATGNRLPPYTFTYSNKLSKSRLTYIASYTTPNGDYIPYESWTSCIGSQVYVDLDEYGNPRCYMDHYAPNATPIGITFKTEDFDQSTVDDYFCLDGICYPNGTIEEFSYEPHRFSKVNNAPRQFNYYDKVQGKRLAARKRYGTDIEQRTDYVYKLHDSNYNANSESSGVLTNPSIHGATYYVPDTDASGHVFFRASRITSGKPFNSLTGPPVCYTEVEEVEHGIYGDSVRTIHYFEPQIMEAPVNYIITYSPTMSTRLIRVDNRIYGQRSGYTGSMASMNNVNYTYLNYPVGEFCNVANVDQPLKEVFIGKDGRVRSVKRYFYNPEHNCKKYGYRLVSRDYPQFSVHMISKSEFMLRRCRLDNIFTTNYYGNECDSIYERCDIAYNKGRADNTYYCRSYGNNYESQYTQNYYPDDILDTPGNGSLPSILAIRGLIEKNIVADPIKTVVKRNGIIIGGECKDYQMLSDMPMLKSLYKIRTTDNNSPGVPIINNNGIDYLVDLYKEGEVMTYDEYLNPEHVRLNDTQNRIYVWGYGGRFPIAVIDNMSYMAFQSNTNLKSAISQLATFRKIENVEDCASLRNMNASIRSMLSSSVHITTYTYDPYFGMTSETDDSNLGTIYTYDSFGRLSAKYDVNYKKLEEYNYHYQLQQ